MCVCARGLVVRDTRAPAPADRELPINRPLLPDHHIMEECASSMHNMLRSDFVCNNKRLREQSSTRYLTQKRFRSECMALFAGCEPPRQAILLASTPARRSAAGCSAPLLSLTTCIRVLNQVSSRMLCCAAGCRPPLCESLATCLLHLAARSATPRRHERRPPHHKGFCKTQ